MYDLTPWAEATDGNKIKTVWLDDWRKEDGTVRSRLVAREVNYFKRSEIVQNTPPLAIIRLMISLATSIVNNWGLRDLCLAAWDCANVFYHASITEAVDAMPPPGSAPPGFFWKLRRAMQQNEASVAFGDLVSRVQHCFIRVTIVAMTIWSQD